MKSILAAVGLSGDARVLKRAIQIAREQSAHLTVLYVAENLWLEVPEIYAMPEVQEARAESVASDLEKLELRIPDDLVTGGSCTARVEIGTAAAMILRVAEDVRADMIIVGAARRKALVAKILGSTADKVVRSATVPVLVVKGPADGAYHKIIAAIDCSASSPGVLHTAAQLCSTGVLELVHVVHIPLAIEQAFLRSATVGGRLKGYKSALLERAQEKLRHLARQLDVRRKPRVRVVSGEPVAVLARLSKTGGPALIVAGRQGHSAISRMLLGSVALRLLRQSSCDVLIAPPPEVTHP